MATKIIHKGKRGSRVNGARTQAKLLRSATKLFARGGFEATSLRQIAADAGVDLATLKYHFFDKPNLFERVYREGHTALVDALRPTIESMVDVDNQEGVRESIREVVGSLHTFLQTHETFARLVMFRLLEDSKVVQIEGELFEETIAWIDNALQNLVVKGVIRQTDTRALLVLLISGLPMWFIASRGRSSWIAQPLPGVGEEGRARSEAFMFDVLDRMLLE